MTPSTSLSAPAAFLKAMFDPLVRAQTSMDNAAGELRGVNITPEITEGFATLAEAARRLAEAQFGPDEVDCALRELGFLDDSGLDDYWFYRVVLRKAV